MSQSAQTITGEFQKRPRRLRRWAAGAAIVLGSLFILILIAGQIIFWTDLPRNLVVNALERQLGLRITAKSLSTGWLGHTTLRDVALTLPLADKAFLSVPTLELRHSPLPWLIVTGSLSVHEITIDDSRLNVVQDSRGSWNLQEVAQLLTRAGGAKNASADSQSNHGIPQLPKLDVNDATLIISDNQGRSATISNLSLTGRPDGPIVWDYKADVPDRLDITGKLAAGGVWSHQIDLKLQDIGSWMSPWIKSWPQSAHLRAHWSGQVTGGQVSGRLDFDDASFGSSKITGPVGITIQSDRATFQPSGLLVANSTSPGFSARVDGGQILLGADDIQSKQLSVAFDGGRGSLDGKLTFADGTANLTAAWRDVGLPESVQQSGDLSVVYTPSLGRPRFSAVLDSQGVSDAVSWDSRFNLDGTGKTLQTLSLSLTAQKLRLNVGGQKSAIDLSGLAARLNRTSDGLMLTDLRLGDSNPITGRAGYTFANKTAWLSLDARGWPIPHAGPNALDLDLNVWSDPTRVHLDQLYLSSGMFVAYCDGDYVFNLPKPVSAHLYFDESSQLAAAGEQAKSFRGILHGNLDLDGTLKPTDLVISGAASGTDVQVGNRPLGNLKLALQGSVRNGQVALASRNIEFLGGNWFVSGQWPVKNTLFRLDTVRVEHLSIPLALARKDVNGQLDGNWSIDVRQFNPEGIFVQGSADVSNLAIAGFAADQIQLPSIHLEDGEIDIKPIKLRRTAYKVDGRAVAEISTTLAHPTSLRVRVDASSWPLEFGNPSGLCVLWAKAKVDIDVLKESALGHVDLRADTSWASKSLGRVDAALVFNRRQISAPSIQVHALGGSASGSGEIDLDHPYQARAELDWTDLNLSGLQNLAPGLSAMSGKISGSLQIDPATGPRPLGPLSIALRVASENVKMSEMALGNAQLFAFAGPHRLVLDDDSARPSQILLAGGTVQFWGRVSKHPGDLYQSLLQVNLKDLDLDAVLPQGTKVARTPGSLSGRITLLGRPGALGLVFGEGHLDLSRSDLAGTGPISILYTFMHLGHNASKPLGYGTVDFDIQRRDISITSLRYFDRGAEVHGAGLIGNILNAPNSPLDLTIVGSARPLTSIDLPGVSDIDEALNAIQRDAVTVRVTGTLNKPESKKILFSAVSQDVRNLLLGGGHQKESPE